MMHFADIQVTEGFGQLQQQVRQALSQAMKKCTSRIAAFDGQLADSTKAETTQKRADMLMANAYRFDTSNTHMMYSVRSLTEICLP